MRSTACAPHVHRIHTARTPHAHRTYQVSLAQLDHAIGRAEARGRLACVKYYAPWCQSCFTIKPLYERTAGARLGSHPPGPSTSAKPEQDPMSLCTACPCALHVHVHCMCTACACMCMWHVHCMHVHVHEHCTTTLALSCTLTLDPNPEQVRRVLRPGGVLVFDTINRSYQSYLLTIVLAQELHLLWLY